MTTTIIPQLVRKDLMITRKVILVFGLVGLASVVLIDQLFGRLPAWALVNLGLVLLLSPAATCGIVLLMKTVVFEKEKSTQLFILSLPVSVKQFTWAKLMVNLPVFGVFWLAISAIGFHFAFGRGLFPAGAIPFVVMVFMGGFVAYAGILGVALWRQSLGLTVLAIALLEMGTSVYLWVIAYLEPVSAFVHGPEAVWNGTAIGIVALQALAALAMLSAAVFVQGRKRDFA